MSWTGVAECPSMAGQRRGERDQDPLLLLPSGGLQPPPLSLCLRLHQINGPGPDRGSVSISTACQACPSPRKLLIHHGFDKHTYTHTCTDVDLVAPPHPELWRKAVPQVLPAAVRYKLFTPALVPPAAATHCLSFSAPRARFLS